MLLRDRRLVNSVIAISIKCLSDYDFCSVETLSFEVWDSVFGIPAIKQAIQTWGDFATMDTEEKIAAMSRNNNLRGSLCSLLIDLSDSGYAFGDNGCDGDDETPVILPLRFSDWERNKRKYLSMLVADMEFLDRLDYKH